MRAFKAWSRVAGAGGLRLRVLALIVAALLVPIVAAEPARMLPREGDPDVPSLTPPVAVLTPFVRDRWQCTEGVRTSTVTVPDAPWNRAVLTLRIDHESDIYDRLFGVSIAGVEVLHGTTPRADFTVSRDVTEYASLLVRGAPVDVSVLLGTWVGFMFVDVDLAFYDDATASLVEPARDHVLGAFRFQYLTEGPGATRSASLTFPDAAPTRAIVEVTTSGHGPGGEFFYLQKEKVPPTFRVYVDGVEVGHATAMPYVYGLVGFGSLACPKTDTFYNTYVHPVMWWSAHRALDAAGVHTGVGEIPAYRAEVPADLLPLLAGAREVTLVQEGGNTGGSNWVTSLSFLLDA